jgi:hypothetical protein
MGRKMISSFLLLALILPEMMMAQAGTRQLTAANAQPAAPAQAQISPPTQETARPQSPARRRSYEQETRGRRRSGISKQEKVFLVAVAGTSMGIGAIAGGGTGLAIGAIVGGWGAYAGHRLWRWIR